MARPTKTEADTRGTTVSFRLRPDELAALDARAEKAGMRRSDYLRKAALSSRITVRPSARPDFETVAALNRIGANLNQLTRVANATGEIPSQVKALCERIETLVTQAADRG